MKIILLLCTTFLMLFANYNYGGSNMGKIDMHGGKKQKLTDKFSSPNFSSLKDISINKPILPKKPEKLIKKEKKKTMN